VWNPKVHTIDILMDKTGIPTSNGTIPYTSCDGWNYGTSEWFPGHDLLLLISTVLLEVSKAGVICIIGVRCPTNNRQRKLIVVISNTSNTGIVNTGL